MLFCSVFLLGWVLFLGEGVGRIFVLCVCLCVNIIFKLWVLIFIFDLCWFSCSKNVFWNGCYWIENSHLYWLSYTNFGHNGGSSQIWFECVIQCVSFEYQHEVSIFINLDYGWPCLLSKLKGLCYMHYALLWDLFLTC